MQPLTSVESDRGCKSMDALLGRNRLFEYLRAALTEVPDKVWMLPPLHKAALFGHHKLLNVYVKHIYLHDKVVEEEKRAILDVPHQGKTALLYATEARCVRSVEVLLEGGANPNYLAQSRLPLRFAVEFCSMPEIAERLHEHGADPHLEHGELKRSAFKYVEERLEQPYDDEGPEQRLGWQKLWERFSMECC